ncbi:MAG: hypothetical protein WD063_00035, partial [Pirellulales bacterium]
MPTSSQDFERSRSVLPQTPSERAASSEIAAATDMIADSAGNGQIPARSASFDVALFQVIFMLLRGIRG